MKPARFAALCLILAASLAGCSRAAMKTTPLWDSEFQGAVGDPEDRINVWPLFYYRNPAYSILWPLVSVTPDGTAFVPFYEYAKPEDELRTGTIHQLLPALAVFNGEEDYRRVLNVVHDGKSGFFGVIPIYFQNTKDNFLLIVPAFAKGKDWFWTPLYMQTPRTKGILGPLFFTRKEGESRSAFFPFPLFGFWKGAGDKFGFMTLPLFFFDRADDGRTVNVGGLIFHQHKQGEDSSSHFIWPLGAAGNKDGEKWNRLFPLWSFKEDKDGAKERAILWPLTNSWKSENEKGGWILPLFYRNKTETGSILATLLGGYSRDGEKTAVNVLGPVYFRSQSPETEYRTIAWPLFHEWKTAKSAGHALFPIYYWNSGEDIREFGSILFAAGREGDTKTMGVGLILYGHERSPSEISHGILAGILGLEASYAGEGAARERERLAHWFFPIYGSTTTKDRKTFRSALNYIDVSRLGPEGERAAMIEEAKKTADERAEKDGAAAEPMKRFASSREIYERRYLLGIGRFARRLGARIPGEGETPRPKLPANDDATTVTAASGAFPLLFTEEKEGRVFPLFSYRSDSREGGKFNILWRLYDADSRVLEDGSEYSRQRVLWRVFHRERKADRTSTDIFPFIALDRAKNLRAWSFAGGLAGYENDAGAKTMKLLYIPVSWGAAKSEPE